MFSRINWGDGQPRGKGCHEFEASMTYLVIYFGSLKFCMVNKTLLSVESDLLDFFYFIGKWTFAGFYCFSFLLSDWPHISHCLPSSMVDSLCVLALLEVHFLVRCYRRIQYQRGLVSALISIWGRKWGLKKKIYSIPHSCCSWHDYTRQRLESFTTSRNYPELQKMGHRGKD